MNNQSEEFKIRFGESLATYLDTEGYASSIDEQQRKKAARGLKLANFLMKLTHKLATGHRYIGGHVLLKGKAKEFELNSAPLRDAVDQLVSRFDGGSLQVLAIIDGDSLDEKSFSQLIATSEKTILRLSQYSAKRSTFFIEQPMAITRLDLFFVFFDSARAQSFRTKHLKNCEISHRFKMVYAIGTLIDCEKRSISMSDSPLVWRKKAKEEKLSAALFPLS